MSTKTTHEPTVALSELGLNMDLDTARAYGAVAGVDIVLDYADRPAVSLDGAYKLGEQRRKADREWHEAQARQRAERELAVKDLAARMNAAFIKARDAAMARLAGQPRFGGPVEIRGEAISAGLDAARMLWVAAPPLVRQEVTRVDAPEGDTIMSYELGMVLPRAVIDGYVHAAAKKL